MAKQFGNVRGVPIIEDSAAPGTPLVDLSLPGGDFLAQLAAQVLGIQNTFPNVMDFGAKGDGTTDDTEAIRSAIEYTYAKGGDGVFLPGGVYFVTEEIEVPERVTLYGHGAPGWETSATVPKNTTISMPPDAGLLNTQGILRLVYRGTDTVGRRHNGGVRDINITGGFDAGLGSPPVNHGIILAGVRFVELSRVHITRVGGNGVYGVTDVSSSNGLQLHNCFAGFNGNHGFVIAGGDNLITHCIAGTNTLDGFSAACGNTVFTNCLSWNNKRDGMADGGVNQGNTFSACLSYDNERAGFAAYSGSQNVCWVGCQAYDNGRNLQGLYTSAVDRVGFLFAAGGTYDLCQILGGFSCGVRVATQEYGVSMRSTTGQLDIQGLRCAGNNLANHFTAGSLGSFRSRPFSDNQILLGDSSTRFARITTADLRVHATSGAANPVASLDSTGLKFGAGGGTAVDVQLSRGAANRLDLAAGDSLKITDGTWNGGLLQLGSNFIWVDATGKLRIKATTAPTSDTDGTVVGTQT